jgi:phage protein U
MLYSLGPLIFDRVSNVHEIERTTTREFARKDVIGARKGYEDVGAGDDTIGFRGRLFPDRIGGRATPDALRTLLETGSPQLLVRGDGRVMGWYVLTSLGERGEYLGADGRAALIEYDIKLERVDQPSARAAFAALVDLAG